MSKAIKNKRLRHIQDNNWIYNLLSPVVQYGFRCHYRSFVVRGIENLPTDSPYIIAPCHQQALMEPLAVLCFAPKPPVFLARADLFNNPTLRRILTFLKIMPVYRIRDGQQQLGRNQEIFDRCRDVLLDGYPLCLMAEGRHNNRHSLLPLVKGMFRIACQTQTALGQRPLYIVPVGIDFDEYERPYANLVVNIGRPIAVQPYMDTYRSNEPLALNQMRDALSSSLSPLMLDIRTTQAAGFADCYDCILTLCNMQNRALRRRQGLPNNAWNRFIVRQQIARRLDALAESDSEEFARQMEISGRFQAMCSRHKRGEKVVAEHWSLAATLLAALAILFAVTAAVVWHPLRMIVLFILLCYPLPLIPTHLMVKPRVADPQFRSSFNWGVRFFGSIVYALVIGIVMAATRGAWMDALLPFGAWYGLVAVAVVVAGAHLSALVVSFLRDVATNLHYWGLRLIHPTSITTYSD